MARRAVLATVALVLALVAAANAVHGVDVSSPVPRSAASCMHKHGYDWAIVRCYESIGAVDTNCANSVRAFRAGGFKNVDVYIFPCKHCGDGAGQMRATIDYIKRNRLNVDRIWLDIEGPGLYWTGDHAANSMFISAMIKEGEKEGRELGVYTSESQWPPIVGSWSGAKHLPLWFANYDRVENYNDFRGFNGWSSPHAKQFNGDVFVCGVGTDVNIAKDSLFKSSPSHGPAPPKHKGPAPPKHGGTPPKHGPAPPKKAKAGFKVGSTVEVATDLLNCRKEPGLSRPIKETLHEGEKMTIKSGPYHKSDFIWWEFDRQCYAAQEFLKLA